jgi:hypothetical protein
MTDRWFLFFLLTWWTARVSRYLWLDDMIKEWRVAVKGWLQLGHIPADIVGTPKMEDWLNTYHNTHPRRELLRRKAYDLIECAWCLSVWIAGFTVLGVWLVARYTDVDIDMPLPVLWTPALSMAAVVLLQWTDGSFPVKVEQKK